MGTFTLTEGSVVSGRYCVIRELGRGGMGAVYEVLDPNTNRLRALKVLLAGPDHDEDLVERFRQEATVAGRVESEHVVEVFDAGFDPAHRLTYLVMELLRGEDLGSKLAKKGRFSPNEVLEALSQVALGLSRTHAEGIVHRDLKPENLFATRRDDGSLRIKILDFGIAKVVSGIAGTPRTTRAFGTPTYMAPEQLSGDGLIDERCDLYALAHVAYTLLAGEPYFTPEHQAAKNVFAFAQTLMSGAREPASERAAKAGAKLPRAFDRWFEKATHREPDERYATASEQILALADAFSLPRPTTLTSIEIGRAKTEPIRAISGSRTESSAVASAAATRRPKNGLWILAAVGAAALLLAVYAFWLRQPHPSPAVVTASAPVATVAGVPSAEPTAPTTPVAIPMPSASTQISPPTVRPKSKAPAPARSAKKPYDPLDDL
jgi:serine/threonine-protein kinase